MKTYTIKPECIDLLCLDLEAAAHIYTLAEVAEDASNFGMTAEDYISAYMDEKED